MSTTTTARLWALVAHHATESRLAENRYRAESAAYHRGKANAYEHAARMIDGTDAS